jgi:hypothetical protein
VSFDSNLISIVIPTYKRPGALIRLLTSIDGSKVENFNVEIIVADNDPSASANEVMTRFMKNNISPITHIHVPEPGVSNARNGALKAAKGRYILFIDDDMEADLDWAQTLAHGALALDATLAFGPAIAVMPADDNPIFDYMQPLFCRVRDYPTGLIDEGIATGNCFLDRAKEALPNPVFDPALNHSGGEDDALFEHLMSQGAKVAWIEDAKTLEHVPESRATLSYVWRRNFAWGQGPTQQEADRGLAGLPGTLKWMAVGCIQTPIYASLWVVAKLRRKPDAVQYLGRLAQGVGKVLWSNRLSPKLYGV